jgi:hypothetical protein
MTAVALAALLYSVWQRGARLDPLRETRALDASRRYAPNFALYMATVTLAAKLLAAQQRGAKPNPPRQSMAVDGSIHGAPSITFHYGRGGLGSSIDSNSCSGSPVA